MALKPCRECKKDVSTDAKTCPHCGKQAPHGGSRIVLFGGGFLAFLFVFYLMSGATTAVANKSLDSIHNQVAEDAVAQYRIAERGSDPLQTCVQAGFVVAAYLQAKDEPKYNQWLDVEKKACAAAGIPK